LQYPSAAEVAVTGSICRTLATSLGGTILLVTALSGCGRGDSPVSDAGHDPAGARTPPASPAVTAPSSAGDDSTGSSNGWSDAPDVTAVDPTPVVPPASGPSVQKPPAPNPPTATSPAPKPPPRPKPPSAKGSPLNILPIDIKGSSWAETGAATLEKLREGCGDGTLCVSVLTPTDPNAEVDPQIDCQVLEISNPNPPLRGGTMTFTLSDPCGGDQGVGDGSGPSSAAPAGS
jgi:hypothetical protein